LAGTMTTITRMIYKLRIYLSAAEEDIDENGSDLIVFSYLAIKVATDNFSEENKLGEGGFGAVYKVTFVNTSICEIFLANVGTYSQLIYQQHLCRYFRTYSKTLFI
jgi:hypothetical protein